MKPLPTTGNQHTPPTATSTMMSATNEEDQEVTETGEWTTHAGGKTEEDQQDETTDFSLVEQSMLMCRLYTIIGMKLNVIISTWYKRNMP